MSSVITVKLVHKIRPFLLIDFNEIEKCSTRIKYSLRSQSCIESRDGACFVLCFVKCPDLPEPDHGNPAIVALAAQIMATLALILTIECKGEFNRIRGKVAYMRPLK